MFNHQTKQSQKYWTAATGLSALALSTFCVITASRFRISPARGDESDLGVLILSALGAPLLLGSAAIASRFIEKKWQFLFWVPIAITITAVCIVTLGVSGRP